MMRFVAALVLGSIVTTAAYAQAPATKPPTYSVQCQPRGPLTQMMISQHASPIIANRSDDDLFEIWSDGDHWMAMVTRSDGMTCPVAEGSGPIRIEPPRCIDPLKCPRV